MSPPGRRLPMTALPILLLTLLLAWAPAAAQPTATEVIAVRDGTRLTADIYLPAVGQPPWPTMLIRTPYGRDIESQRASALQGAGVAVVVQDVRGRGASEGVPCAFLCDGDGPQKDGLDTVSWLVIQPWFNGRLHTMGGSALGVLQYLLASTSPPLLHAMWVEVATPSLYDHLFFFGGVFNQDLLESWLEGQGASSFLQTIAAHPLDDGFWDVVQTLRDPSAFRVPGVHIGGWYDILCQGTLDAFTALQHQGSPGARGQQKLIMGPWHHANRGEPGPCGELTYPPDSQDIPGQLDTLYVTWAAHYLGLIPDPAAVAAIPAVQYYVMGDVDDPAAPGNEWRTAAEWPIPAAPVRLYLQPDGALAEACPPVGGASRRYSYDPANPCPTIGGATLNPVVGAGPYDQSTVEARSDVLSFSTPVLNQPQEISGRIKAHLWVAIDRVDTNLAVRLTDVYPDGRSMLIQEGIVRLANRNGTDRHDWVQPGQVVAVEVDLWSTSIVINRGHQLRALVTSSSSPRFWNNPNDGSHYGGQSTPLPVQVTLLLDAEHPSYLELPAPDRRADEVIYCQEPGQDAGLRDGPLEGDAAARGDNGADGRALAQDADQDAPGSDEGCSCATGGDLGPLGMLPLLWLATFLWRRLKALS